MADNETLTAIIMAGILTGTKPHELTDEAMTLAAKTAARSVRLLRQEVWKDNDAKPDTGTRHGMYGAGAGGAVTHQSMQTHQAGNVTMTGGTMQVGVDTPSFPRVEMSEPANPGALTGERHEPKIQVSGLAEWSALIASLSQDQIAALVLLLAGPADAHLMADDMGKGFADAGLTHESAPGKVELTTRGRELAFAVRHKLERAPS